MNKGILTNHPKNAREIQSHDKKVTPGYNTGMEGTHRSYLEYLVFFVIILITLESLGYLLLITYKKAIMAEKQLELRMLTDAVAVYNIHHDEFPSNPTNYNHWCEIGKSYLNGVCLEEIQNSQYVSNFPTDLSRKKYYYQVIDDTAYIATKVDTKHFTLSPNETCYGDLGETMLCYTIQ